jgi:hypothetical protein
MLRILLNNMHTQLNLPTSVEFPSLQEISARFDQALNLVLVPKLDALVGRQVLFNTEEKELSPLGGWEGTNHVTGVRNIEPVAEPTVVAAIDSSCVFIGETSDGSIYSAKCGLALAFMGTPSVHFKIGPVLFYINDDLMNSDSINERLRKFVLYDIAAAKQMIRIRIERIVQGEMCRLLRNAIVLLDGSLRRSVFEDRHSGINSILRSCETNQNQVIGISKTTRLRVLDQMASSLLRNNYACYIDVSSIVRSLVSSALGRSLLARFSNDGVPLRADLLDDPLETLGRLIANDGMAQGYPETLRLAHHVSVFTQTDITCVKGFILSQFGAKEMMHQDVRRTLLGSFS